MTPDDLCCADDHARRAQVRDAGLTGLDFVEVDPDGRTLRVFFVNRPPDGLTAAQLRVEGGGPGRQVSVLRVRRERQRDPAVDECVAVTLDRPGDASRYVLRVLDRTDIDPRFAALGFSFAVACPGTGDCAPEPCVPEPPPEPDIDYLAKDYASFRRLLLDRLALTLPWWRERHVPDVGITLVELLAYVADHLSYHQDAVATEAYLDTARLRTSVRRHARLVDYTPHEGCSARAWLHVETDGDLTLPAGITFATRDGQVFAPTRDAPRLWRVHNLIQIYTWGLRDCVLPAGSTTATLLAPPGGLHLAPGDPILFEEGAGRAGRHVVVLTAVRAGTDPVTGLAIADVAWDRADGLPFPLCLPGAARANLLLVDHGAPIAAEDLDGALRRAPLTFAVPEQPGAPAVAVMRPDPAGAVPAIRLTETTAAGVTTAWTARSDLLGSGPEDRHFVVETDAAGRATLRFGDGTLGARRPPGSRFVADYRCGTGPGGNVGADTITQVVMPAGHTDDVGLRPRNPLPAQGGAAPEPLDHIRLAVPHAYRRVPRRAVTGADYAALAAHDPRVQRAHGALRWTGSWYEVDVAVDPFGAPEAGGDELLAAIAGALEPYRRIGHDLRVTTAVQVPLDIAMTICVAPHHLPGRVRAAVLAVLGSGIRPDGRLGLFHPDALTFGTPVLLSRVVAAVQAVEGVQNVDVTVFQRLFAPARGELAAGVLPIGPGEVARLDNAPGRPELGRLRVTAEGGSR